MDGNWARKVNGTLSTINAKSLHTFVYSRYTIEINQAYCNVEKDRVNRMLAKLMVGPLSINVDEFKIMRRSEGRPKLFSGFKMLEKEDDTYNIKNEALKNSALTFCSGENLNMSNDMIKKFTHELFENDALEYWVEIEFGNEGSDAEVEEYIDDARELHRLVNEGKEYRWL